MLLIKNGYIKSMAGDDIENGCILIDDNGKIAEISTNIEAPEGAEIIDAGGRIVTPGCIDAHTHVGLSDEFIGQAAYDANEKTEPVTPHMRAIDGLNPVGEIYEEGMKAGVTSVCTGPGSANVVGGTFLAMKLYGNNVEDMIIKNPIAMKVAFGENPKRIHGQQKGRAPMTRMGSITMLRELLFKAKKYAEEDANGEKHAFDMKLEAMIPVMRGEIPLKAHAHQANDILSAIRVAKEFGLKLTLDHCTDGVLIPKEVKASGFPVLLGPMLGKKSKHELANKSFENPGKLHKEGIPISIVTDSPILPLQYLPLSAGLAVKEGLDYEAAWRAITINPAKAVGIDDRVGSLEKGKDADIVIWTMDPMIYVGGESYKTIIDGKVVYSK